MGNSENEFKNVSNQIIDMLVDSTLKKHEVNLEPKKIDSKEKEELRKLVNNLEKSVEALTQTKKEKE